MVDRLTVAHAGRLLDVLAQHFASKGKNTWSKNTLRQRLQLGCIEVNGTVVTRAGELLAVGDAVEILGKSSGRTAKRGGAELAVLFDDQNLLAIDKPSGLLSVSTDEEQQRTALFLARESFAHRGDLWPVHRLDRETSGVLLFARSRDVRDQVQAAWQDTQKTYAAIVEGVPDVLSGTIEQPLWEDRNLRVRVGQHEGAKAARTRYETIASRRGRSHLDVHLDTGRKHQIRAHLAWLGHAIVGDRRYGTADTRLCLHARRLVLRHPVNRSELCLESPVPPMLLRALQRR